MVALTPFAEERVWNAALDAAMADYGACPSVPVSQDFNVPQDLQHLRERAQRAWSAHTRLSSLERACSPLAPAPAQHRARGAVRRALNTARAFACFLFPCVPQATQDIKSARVIRKSPSEKARGVNNYGFVYFHTKR